MDLGRQNDKQVTHLITVEWRRQKDVALEILLHISLLLQEYTSIFAENSHALCTSQTHQAGPFRGPFSPLSQTPFCLL